MSEDEVVRIAGKTFSKTTDPVDPELVAYTLAVFAEYDRQRAAGLIPEATEPLPERFHDDMIGTEYEPW